MSSPEELMSLLEGKQLTSGELFYHALNFEGVYKPLYKDHISDDFWAFLRPDYHNKFMQQNIADIIKIGELTCKTHLSKIKSGIEGPTTTISLCKNSTIKKVAFENTLVSNKLSELLAQYEGHVMQLVLDYYSVLKTEVEANRNKLHIERANQQVLANQAAVLRDIRLFACHLTVETKGQLSLSMLQAESQQFVRCVKAVTDNVNLLCCNTAACPSVDHLKENLRVPNVFKLQNSFLSGKLKTASEKVSNGKVKGLFCCLSVEQFYKFSAFGLFMQSVPQTPTGRQHRSSSARTSSSSAAQSVDSIAASLFSTAWFCSAPPVGVPINRSVAHIAKVSGTALRLATGRSDTTELEEPLRFSRFSTISNLKSFSRDDLERGVFLSLCRVLIVHQCTIATPIRPADIIEAAAQNYDALYSSATEEYVLLQPNFVLPEFFMQVQLPDVFRPDLVSTPAAQLPFRPESSLPPMLQSSSSDHRSISQVAKGSGDGEGEHGVGLDSSVSALDILMKRSSVHQLFLQNQMEATLRARGPSVDVWHSDQFGGIAKAVAPSPLSSPHKSMSPLRALERKQEIVEALQALIASFQQHSARLLRDHAASMSEVVLALRDSGRTHKAPNR